MVGSSTGSFVWLVASSVVVVVLSVGWGVCGGCPVRSGVFVVEGATVVVKVVVEVEVEIVELSVVLVEVDGFVVCVVLVFIVPVVEVPDPLLTLLISVVGLDVCEV